MNFKKNIFSGFSTLKSFVRKALKAYIRISFDEITYFDFETRPELKQHFERFKAQRI